jgi:hypothetical protein
LSGTCFPRLIVTLAAVLVFHLLAAAMAKLILQHRGRAAALFLRIVTIYVVMGIVSLIYAAVWLAVLSDIPRSLPGVRLPTPVGWATQILNTFSNIVSQQPLLQALASSNLGG